MIQGQKEKPRKIVINNVRKSMMAMGTTAALGLPAEQAPTVQQINQAIGAISQNISNTNINDMHIIKSEIKKLNEEVTYYKQKNEQNLIKIRFLTNKLQSYGGMNQIPVQIVKQIEETDQKIKKLQDLFYFKRSKQMMKVKKKVKKFVEMLEFQLTDEDLNKIEDEVEIIFFLIDIFTQKYNEIKAQKTHNEQLISMLKEDPGCKKQKLQQQNNFLRQKNNEQSSYIHELQLQIFNLRRQTQNVLKNATSKQQVYKNNTQQNQNNINNKIYQDIIKGLQIQNQNYILKISQLDIIIKNYDHQIINYKQKIYDFQKELNKQKNKSRDQEEEYHKIQKEEQRWKERYTLMEKQKNQRIELLEREKKSIDMSNGMGDFNIHERLGKQKASHGQSFPGRKESQEIRKKMQFDPRYKINDEIIEDSGDEQSQTGKIP